MTLLRYLLVNSPVPQYQIAAACCMTPITLSQISRSQRRGTPIQLQRLADYFELDDDPQILNRELQEVQEAWSL